MKKYFLLITLLVVISCNTTNSDNETSDLSLQDVIPNSTWYYANLNERYTKTIFGDLNTTVESSDHDLPCGSSPIDTYVDEYTLINGEKLLIETEEGSEILLNVESFTREKIVLYNE